MIDFKILIEESLNIPVIEDFSPILPPCCTWYQIADTPGLMGNGRETEVEEQYQIDVWAKSKDQVVDLSKKLKETMILNTYITVPAINYSFDTNGKVWRGSINFNYIKEA